MFRHYYLYEFSFKPRVDLLFKCEPFTSKVAPAPALSAMKEVVDPYTLEDLAEYLEPKPEDEEGGLTTEGEGRPRSRKLS